MKEKQLTKKVTIDVYVKELGVWTSQDFTAKVFELRPGRFTRLLPIGVLSRALCRTSQTITMWEQQGKIPQPAFVIEGFRSKTRRWYSEAQIRMMQHHQREVLGDNPTSCVNQRYNLDEFFSRVRRDWLLELND